MLTNQSKSRYNFEDERQRVVVDLVSEQYVKRKTATLKRHDFKKTRQQTLVDVVVDRRIGPVILRLAKRRNLRRTFSIWTRKCR